MNGTRPHPGLLRTRFVGLLTCLALCAALLGQSGLSFFHLATCADHDHGVVAGESRPHGTDLADHAGIPRDSHDHEHPAPANHDPDTCKTCQQLLLLKLTTTIDIPIAGVLLDVPASVVFAAVEIFPSVRAVYSATARGPPRTLVS